MRILYHHRTQAEDGQAVHIRALMRAFEECGHQVDEVSLVRRTGEAEESQDSGNRWSWVGKVPRFARELMEYAYSAPARRHIMREAARTDPDFIYERYAFGNAGGVWAKTRLKLPLVLEVNSPMVIELERTRGLSFPKLAKRMEDSIFCGADLVCVVTEVLGDMLVECGVERERLLVTPNGVHLEQYERPDPEGQARAARRALGIPESFDDHVVLGFVGYYRRWHRLDLALEAMVRPELARTVLAIIGDGPAHDELVQQAEELGVRERVFFCGPRAHADIPDLLAAFDVALVPAINPYASPLKLHEYMAARLAVVAPDQPNLCEVLVDGDNGLLVEPGHEEAFGEALVALVTDPERRATLGRRARETIEERDMTWTGNARRVIAAVEALA